MVNGLGEFTGKGNLFPSYTMYMTTLYERKYIQRVAYIQFEKSKRNADDKNAIGIS